MIYEVDNLRFSSRKMREDPADTTWLIDVTRISDQHWLTPQMWFRGEPHAEEVEIAATEWIAEHPGLNDEPPTVHCLACNKVLESDQDTAYQFDNALWIGFFGSYGMFTDNMSGFPTNSEDQFLHCADGRLILDGHDKPMRNPGYVPEYEEKRILPGRPDHEAVICHECAHDLCDLVPWIYTLIQPVRSHAHRQPEPFNTLFRTGHHGWDLDHHRVEQQKELREQ